MNTTILTYVAVASLSLSTFALAEADDAGLDTSTTAETGTLSVLATGLETSDGKLRFVMFDSEENFLKNAFRAEVVSIDNEQGTWVVRDLPYGDYAVLVHHDVDGSGAMERHWYGKPKEPTGSSNNAPARFGPPKYKKTRFTFDRPGLTITIFVQ